MYKGGKRKNTSITLPLRVVEINFYQHNESALASITSISVSQAQTNLYQNPIKTSVLFFMSEFLNQLLAKVQYSEPNLFDELRQELIWLNESNEMANYPIFWTIQWIEKLGIKPTVADGSFFDIELAQITAKETTSLFFYQGEEIRKLAILFQSQRIDVLSFQLSKIERSRILNVLMDYCKFHIPEFKKFKSIEVLQTVLS